MNERPPLPVSPPSAFENRRARLAGGLHTASFLDAVRESSGSSGAPAPAPDPCFVLSSGWARPRNFAHNTYPFRAESHFLYLVGRQIEGALLVFESGSYTLYLEPPDPDLELWHGKAPTLAELEADLSLRVRPLAELGRLHFPSVLPPQDEETAGWLTELFSRPVTAQGGGQLSGADAALADLMVEQRLVHDAAALVQMRAAGSATAAAHLSGMAVTRRARFAREVRGAMEGELTARGLCPAYTSIVTVYGEVLHAPQSTEALSPLDLLLCDVGGETPEGFAADVTRTWPVSGRFTRTQEELYQLVLSVQKTAISRVKPGVRFSHLHMNAVREMAAGLSDLGILRGSSDELFESGAAALFFPHGLGHLLGLDVHDMEDLGDRAGYDEISRRKEHPALCHLRLDRELRENMVVTIEPGFYRIPSLLSRARADLRLAHLVDFEVLSQFSDVRGIRIEDDVLVTREGAEVLSGEVPKETEDLLSCLGG